MSATAVPFFDAEKAFSGVDLAACVQRVLAQGQFVLGAQWLAPLVSIAACPPRMFILQYWIFTPNVFTR